MTAFSAIARAARSALLIAGIAFAGAAAPAVAGESAAFVAGMPDVPVMPGLSSGGEEPLVFDKPTGRIVETVLQGRVAAPAVRDFYARTMPQLGWRRVDGDRFRREGEELRLEFPPAAGGATAVRFVLMPR